MFKRLSTIKIGLLEFAYKLLIVLFIIMPICMGIFFWIGIQIDAAINIHLFKFITPFLGSGAGFFCTALLIQAGHKLETPSAVEEPAKPYSDRLVSKHSEPAVKPSVPHRTGLYTPYSMQGGK